MEKGLVSILTPCYNGETFIHRLLDSVLFQDYSLIEMIVVDDGSTDNTKSIIEKYKEKFKERGFSLHYHYKENSGQAASINEGLKFVKGEFFIWPDADDYFSSNHTISKFVEAFAKLDNTFGLVRCYANNVDDEDFTLLNVRKHNINSEFLFDSFIDGTESHAGAGLYMVKTEAFDAVNPKREIFIGFRPQNLQLLLPVIYSFKCFTITEPLHTILIRKNSHSRRDKSYEQMLNTYDSYLTIHHETLDRMLIPDEIREKNKKKSTIKILNEKLYLAISSYNKRDAWHLYKDIKSKGGDVSRNRRIKLYVLMVSPILLKLMLKYVR